MTLLLLRTPDAEFGSLLGVEATRVGYVGGKKPGVPTYHAILDFSEGIQIDFDPAVLPLSHLLELVWSAHDAFRPGWGTQYAHRIFFTPSQEEEVRRSAVKHSERNKKAIVTTLEPMSKFYVAEDYHQKYTLRHHSDLVKAIKFKSEEQLRESKVAAKLNGWLAGESLKRCQVLFF
jgi:methionine-S-sulfoxide reductase